MADLTRLRTILLEHGSSVVPVGSAVYHLTKSPVSHVLVDANLVSEVLAWMAAAPGPFFGDLISSAGITPADCAQLLEELTDKQAAEAATMVNAMTIADDEWDRGTRDQYTTATVLHERDAAKIAAQSSAEFAALDALTAAGYAGVDDAVGALSVMRRTFKHNYKVHVRQFARSRHCVVARFVRSDGAVRIVITPWCLSRRNAQAYAALCMADWHRHMVEMRTINRARTVATFAERTSLQAVRDIIAPALALLTRYSYDATNMAFVDGSGRPVQKVGARAPYVAVAFAAVFSSGVGDATLGLARARKAAADTLTDAVKLKTATDYLEMADSPFAGLALFSRALAEYRDKRHASPWGDRVNKGAMLGYVARERDKLTRNTAACINRIEEIAALLAMKGHHKDSTLYVVEWGGRVSAHAVLGAAATAKIDIALDVAGSGVDVPGIDVYADDDDPPHHYQLYLASARRRMLPRMPSVPYRAGTPLIEKLSLVYESVGGRASDYKLAYVNGGMSQLAETPVSVCTDSNARMAAMDGARLTLPIPFYSTEVLLPPACHHIVDMDPDEYLDDFGTGNPNCFQCEAHYRALSAVGDALDRPGVRLTKPRSVFAHNALFGLEWIGTDSAMEDSLETLDAAIACNALRNYEYPNPPPDPTPGKDLSSPDLLELMQDSVRQVYTLLAGPFAGPLPSADAQSVAASVA
ncbi:hypothetical protein [Alternaria alternata polymycovirus 1]|nr:hypothetical protein [Alternaria alternata polymycovirus 1]